MNTLTDEDVDALRAQPDESGLWFHDEPRDDETQEVEVPIVVTDDDGEQDQWDDDRRRLTLPQHEAIDDLRDVYPDLIVEGSTVWLPGVRVQPATGCRLVLPHLPGLRVVDVTALVPGTWLDLDHPSLTGA